jgi:hypothetical protein
MNPDRTEALLAAARRRNAARHARERAKTIVRKDRRPDMLAAGRAHRALLKLYTRAETEYRACMLHPAISSISAAYDLSAELRHTVDSVRELAYKCVGSPAADAMRLRLREDASMSMRLVRRIAALRTSILRRAPPPAQAAPMLAPITPPPAPPDHAPLHHAPDSTAPNLRSEYYWEKIIRRADGSLKEWQAQRKAARARYTQSEKGKTVLAAAHTRYAQSEKGKAARARYAQSEKGKTARKRAQAAYRARKRAPRQESH